MMELSILFIAVAANTTRRAPAAGGFLPTLITPWANLQLPASAAIPVLPEQGAVTPGWQAKQAAKLASDAIAVDQSVPHHEKVVLADALAMLSGDDLAMLNRFTPNEVTPVQSLIQQFPQSSREELMDVLISSLRRLEGHGLIKVSTINKSAKPNLYTTDQNASAHRWQSKQIALSARGEKLTALLKQCAEKLNSGANATPSKDVGNPPPPPDQKLEKDEIALSNAPAVNSLP
jgi:hypothetical protein